MDIGRGATVVTRGDEIVGGAGPFAFGKRRRSQHKAGNERDRTQAFHLVPPVEVAQDATMWSGDLQAAGRLSGGGGRVGSPGWGLYPPWPLTTRYGNSHRS